MDSIISNDNPAYTSRFICDYGTMNSEKWTYTPKNADSFKLTAQIVYEPNNTVIESKEVDVIISDIPTANSEIKYLAIGDSTTEAGGYTNRLLTKFNSVIPNITLLGTELMELPQTYMKEDQDGQQRTLEVQNQYSITKLH